MSQAWKFRPTGDLPRVKSFVWGEHELSRLLMAFPFRIQREWHTTPGDPTIDAKTQPWSDTLDSVFEHRTAQTDRVQVLCFSSGCIAQILQGSRIVRFPSFISLHCAATKAASRWMMR